ncbi:MAG: PfkB family carbohydrate kinase [Methanosarcinales archaeon]
MKSPKFVAIGNITHDIYGNEVRSESDYEYRIGGSSVYSSITARNFGIKAGIVSNIGKDFKFFGLLHNIDISYAICENTTTFRNVYTNGRKQYVFKIADPITPTQIPYTFLNAEIIYICPVLNEVDSNILKLFKYRNSPLIGVSPQGWVRCYRRNKGDIIKKEWDNAKEILQYTDVLIFSEEDIPEYNSKIEEYTANKNLIVIVTKGKNGADLYFKGKIYHFPAYPTKEKDPTGAGDVFGAAFLIKYYESGDIIESARFATCSASFVVEKIGINGIPKLIDVNKRCKGYG